LPHSAGPDSYDFAPVLFGEQATDKPVRESLVIKSGSGLMTIRDGDWKLINGLGSGGFTKPSRIKPEPGGPKGQLYNLAEDIGETNNLYKKHPDIVNRLMEKMAHIRAAKGSRY